MYTTSGIIKVIFDTQTFPSGFTKREFVVTVGDDNYPQDIKFETIKDKCVWLDNYKAGQQVTVSFDVRGNEHNEKYYVNLNCWKIEAAGQQATPQQGSQHKMAGVAMPQKPADTQTPQGGGGEPVSDDIPFSPHNTIERY